MKFKRAFLVIFIVMHMSLASVCMFTGAYMLYTRNESTPPLIWFGAGCGFLSVANYTRKEL